MERHIGRSCSASIYCQAPAKHAAHVVTIRAGLEFNTADAMGFSSTLGT